MNTLFTTFFEIQFGDPMWVMILKGINCVLIFCGVERLLDRAIRWYNRQIGREDVKAK